MRRGPRRSRAAARPNSAPRAKISKTCAIPAPSSNTARWCIAAQRRRRSLDDLIKRTPADGMVGGTRRASTAICSAKRNPAACVDVVRLHRARRHPGHSRTIARRIACSRSPRSTACRWFSSPKAAADVPAIPTASASGLDCMAFHYWGRLSGSGAAGRDQFGALLRRQCGVARMLRRRDRRDGYRIIGMGGPAMIEGGGLGIFRPEEVGPMTVQVPNGVVDIAGGGRSRSGARRRKSIYPTFRDGWQTGNAPISGCCAGSFPRIACAFTTSAK